MAAQGVVTRPFSTVTSKIVLTRRGLATLPSLIPVNTGIQILWLGASPFERCGS